MGLIESTVIVADDLTGANDTVLQYFKRGCSSKIIIDCEYDLSGDDVEAWSISTESRNIEKEIAVERTASVIKRLSEATGSEKFYKKIDSTLRGNTGLEIFTALEVLQKEVAIVAPAYIEEGRTTIGGYQLLNGVPIERTQCALDPLAPIFDSCVADILKKDLNPQLHDLIGNIEFNVVLKGAGPIILKINELVQKGKKIIIIDAASNVDLEQIALAIDKSQYDILPCGSAGLANAINKNYTQCANEITKYQIPNYARLIVSGSATQLSANQIQKLKETNREIYFLDLTIENIINGLLEEEIDLICQKLSSGIDVVVHSSMITCELNDETAQNKLIDAGIAKNEFSGKITDFLAGLVEKINYRSNFIMVIIGGETSFKCTKKLNSVYLKIVDAIAPAIPLCVDKNGKIIVTKSGNFGSVSILADILNYFDRQKNEQI